MNKKYYESELSPKLIGDKTFSAIIKYVVAICCHNTSGDLRSISVNCRNIADGVKQDIEQLLKEQIKGE